MASLTRRKLEEAGFFLAHLQLLLQRPDAPSIPDIGYHLSAFVSAARSVTWVMRYEYSEVVGWEGWFARRGASTSEAELLQRFNELRLQTNKRAPLTPQFVPLLIPDVVYGATGSVLPSVVTVRAGSSASHPLIVEGGKLEWVIEVENHEVRYSCEAYHKLLTEVVDECEAGFSIPPAH